VYSPTPTIRATSHSASDVHKAYHEAGHAVAREILRPWAIDHVSVIPDRDAGTAGRVMTVQGDVVSDDEKRDEAVALCAGAVAELRLDPSQEDAVRAGASDDEEQLSTLLGADADLIVECRERARACVAEHWTEVEALANELLVHPLLDGTEVPLILAAATGDLSARAYLASYRAAGPRRGQ
jgi:ATP-dependent Zn protease